MRWKCAVQIGIALLGGILPAVSSAAGRPPNIVLIIGDDHGWPYSGFMGDPVAWTPNLDALAEGGTVFTQVQMPASVCQPSLQTLLSGLHPRQWAGRRDRLKWFLLQLLPAHEEVEYYRTLPKELSALGYRSWEGGKMWEGTFEQAGFDRGLAVRTLGPGLKIHGGDFGRLGWDTARCGPTGDPSRSCPALDPVADFLDETGDAPFFLWFAPKLPHTPFDAPSIYRTLYQLFGVPWKEARYYAQVTWLDALVGELLATLDARGLRDDTLLLYVSDNGWDIQQGTFLVDRGHGKGTPYELGTRSPLVLNWPGTVPAGVVREDLVAGEDIFPTILDYAGAEALPDRPGRSLKPAIESGEPFGREEVVGFHRGGRQHYTGHFVRTARWRYVALADGREVLYEVAVDPFEREDVAALHPDLLERFRESVASWEVEIVQAPARLEAAGRLVDADGKPIAGASLRLRDGARELEVLTDAQGWFRFRNLAHGAYALRAGRGVEHLSMSRFEGEIPFSLPVGPTGAFIPALVGSPRSAPGVGNEAAIVGVVRGADRKPLADARVTVIGVGGRRFVRVAVSTDAEGRYVAEHLPAGRYRVRAGPRSLGHAGQRVALTDSERREVDLVVPVRSSPHGSARRRLSRLSP